MEWCERACAARAVPPPPPPDRPWLPRTLGVGPKERVGWREQYHDARGLRSLLASLFGSLSIAREIQHPLLPCARAPNGPIPCPLVAAWLRLSRFTTRTSTLSCCRPWSRLADMMGGWGCLSLFTPAPTPHPLPSSWTMAERLPAKSTVGPIKDWPDRKLPNRETSLGACSYRYSAPPPALSRVRWKGTWNSPPVDTPLVDTRCHRCRFEGVRDKTPRP
jgi:hypothetical protein